MLNIADALYIGLLVPIEEFDRITFKWKRYLLWVGTSRKLPITKSQYDLLFTWHKPNFSEGDTISFNRYEIDYELTVFDKPFKASERRFIYFHGGWKLDTIGTLHGYDFTTKLYPIHCKITKKNEQPK